MFVCTSANKQVTQIHTHTHVHVCIYIYIHVQKTMFTSAPFPRCVRPASVQMSVFQTAPYDLLKAGLGGVRPYNVCICIVICIHMYARTQVGRQAGRQAGR